MLRARPVVSSILNRVRVPLLPQNCALCSNWMSHVTSRCFGHCALLHVAPVIVAHQARAAKIVEVDAVEAGVGVCDEVRAHLQHALVSAHTGRHVVGEPGARFAKPGFSPKMT